MPATGKAKTRRQRVEAREGAILRSAAELFARHEVDAVTMGAIARRAGVAEGTVYLYFESKVALVHAVVEAFYSGLTEQAAAGVRKIRDTRRRLEFLAEHHVTRLIEQRYILFAFPGKSLSEPDGEAYRLNRTYVAVFDDVIREGVDRGEIRDDVPLWVLRDMFYGSLEYAARTSLLGGKQRDRRDGRRAVRGLMAVLERGVIRPKSDETVELARSSTMEGITARLESVADRLELVEARTGTARSRASRRAAGK